MLTLQFVPHHEIASMSSIGKIRKLLNLAKDNKIVILEGRLKSGEEAELIKATMEEINADFKGIELAVLESAKQGSIKGMLANLLLREQQGTTIIGPANLVKEIKKDPNKIQLFIRDSSKGSKGFKKTRRK